MIRKKRGVISTNKVEKIPGLDIVIPRGISTQTRKKALRIGKTELAKRNRTAQARLNLSTIEAKIADFIKDRTVELKAQTYGKTKYYITRNGKCLQIKKGTDRGKKIEVKDVEEIVQVIKRLAHNMEPR